MAGARPGVHIVQLKRITVPKCMIEGEKFVKWDEDSGAGMPVTVRVDPQGFWLYWANQKKETECLDISFIRDTRTGKGAKVPRDPKLRQAVTIGSAQDTLEEKTLTLVSGPDFTNLTYFNFCCNKKETAQIWADNLVSMAYNIMQRNGSIMAFLQKIHTKLTIMTDQQGKIPVKNIIKAFATNKDDRKKVEKALEASGISTGKPPLPALALTKPVEKLAKGSFISALNDTVNPAKFTFEEFFTFYKHLTVRPEVEKVFDEFSGYSKKKLMSAEQFMEFINKEQRDPRLNEILYPYTTPERAQELINIYEPKASNAQQFMISLDGFIRYLLSEDCAIVAMEKYDLSDDMERPLNHYFINSSHNTYLTGHQLTGRSSVEMYRQSLLAGCRCVELDFWNGRSEDPIIVHGYTLVPEIPAKDVIEAIAESAFKTSDYPVILSFENHCNTKQQAKIAQYCREFFGPMLLDEPVEGYPLEPGVSLPPPSQLKRRVIIKNKKKHHHHKQQPQKKMSKALIPENGESPPLLAKDDSKDSVENEDKVEDTSSTMVDEEESMSSEDDDDSAEPDDLKNIDKSQSDRGTAGKESEAGAELSALVNYVQPVHFYSFESSKNRNKSYEMSSFDEKQAMTLLKERPVEFVNYNKHQLSRVYPKGTRVDSSNFTPQLFWNAGCQLVALNYQTLDLAMQLNLGIFEQNNQCGYLLKPEFMRITHRRFDPFAESTVDGIIAGTVSIKVISGQFLSDKRVGTYVEVEMYGLPTDTVRKRFKTKMVPANGINPVFDEEPFEFKKVVLPDLACIRIAVSEESGKMIGHRVLPVKGLRPGYRHVVLRNESGQPLNSVLFLLVRVKDYVPDGFEEFAEALANPIKHHNERDKRAMALSVLQDDTQDESAGSANEDSEPITNKFFRNPSYLRKFHHVDPNSASNYSHSPPSSTGPMGIANKSDSFDESGSLGKKSSITITGPSTGSGGGGVSDSGAAPAGTNVSGSPGNRAVASGAGAGVVAGGGGGGSVAVGGGGGSASAGGGGSGSGGSLKSSTSAGQSNYIIAAKNIIEPEPLKKFWEQKAIRDKKAELEKKLETLRRKHEKDRKDPKKDPRNKKRHVPLLKKISSTNLVDFPLCKKDSIPSQSLIHDQMNAEREVMEKGNEEIFTLLDKTVKAAQTQQLSLLKNMEKKENAEIMNEIANCRKDEFRRLTKLTKDKNELDRMKREITTRLVEMGVQEREKIAKNYHKHRTELEAKHTDIILQLKEEKEQTFREIDQEIQERLQKLLSQDDDELQSHSSGIPPHSS